MPTPARLAAGRSVVSRPPLWRRAVRWLRIAAEVMTIAIAIGTLLMWCSIPSTASLEQENPSSTAFIDLRREQAEDAGRKLEIKWQWRPLAKISRYLRAAVIYAEDYNFYRHDGVDWQALEHAIEANLDKGTLAIGGSTITQQLAKNLYLSPSRSFIRKAREMLIAFSLEDHLSKQRILELYLNVVEWGDGIFGAEAAAKHWFGRSAQVLQPAEAVRLAIALPNPITRAPNVRSPDLAKKAVRIVHLLRMQGLIDEAQERVALDQVGAPAEPTLPTRKAGEPVKPAAPADAGVSEPAKPEPEPEPTKPGPAKPEPQPEPGPSDPPTTPPPQSPSNDVTP